MLDLAHIFTLIFLALRIKHGRFLLLTRFISFSHRWYREGIIVCISLLKKIYQWLSGGDMHAIGCHVILMYIGIHLRHLFLSFSGKSSQKGMWRLGSNMHLRLIPK